LLTIYFLGYMIPVRFVAKKSFLKSWRSFLFLLGRLSTR
jgi:hypothetical protein